MADKIDVPAWFERALDPSTPTTEDQETMRTASTYVEDLGGEVIYPTIRMNKAGRLFRPKNPLKSALDNGDYILVEGPAGEETAMKATELSKRMSEAVGKARTPTDTTDAKIADAEDRLTSETVSFNKGGMGKKRNKKKNETKKAFAEGGVLKDEGGTVDPVSGNDVPPGALQKEVRDDIPAQLSEGEFVLPADVVRYIGLENLMELRQKAKEGLARMEDMGQMGNSEEAVLGDDEMFESEIDDLIDSFDPNDPEIQSFADGGMPTYSYTPQQNIYGTQNYNPYNILQQPQQSTVGYRPQSTYMPTPMQYTGGQQFTSYKPGGMVEQRQYIGPNGQLITITFIDGKPQQEIPAGFKVFTPTAPQVEAPTVEAPKPDETGGGGGDGADTSQAEAEYAGYVSEMEQLAKLDEKVAEEWGKSLHNPANQKVGPLDALSNFIKAGGIVGSLKNDYNLHSAVQQQAPSIAQKFGLDINNYKNTGLSAVFSTYNTDALARDAIVADAVSKSLGIDPTKLSRDMTNLFMEDQLTTKELNDMLGRTSTAQAKTTSFADAARAGTYDDTGYEQFDSPTTPSSVAGGTVDASGNVAVGGVVSNISDTSLAKAARDIVAGQSMAGKDISVGNLSVTGVAKNGDVNVDIDGDGIADRRVSTDPTTGKTNSYNFNIDRSNDTPTPTDKDLGFDEGDTGDTGRGRGDDDPGFDDGDTGDTGGFDAGFDDGDTGDTGGFG